MLSDLRKALADTIQSGLQGAARVYAYPPLKIDMPSTGVHVYIEPDGNDYLEAWGSMSTAGRGTVRYQIVLHCPDDNPARRWDQLDDLIDPLSTSPNVFGALYANPTLGITGFQAQVTAYLSSVSAPTRVSEADGSTTFYELRLPVQVIVQRS
jgi:hypothetical protein